MIIGKSSRCAIFFDCQDRSEMATALVLAFSRPKHAGSDMLYYKYIYLILKTSLQQGWAQGKKKTLKCDNFHPENAISGPFKAF